MWIAIVYSNGTQEKGIVRKKIILRVDYNLNDK